MAQAADGAPLADAVASATQEEPGLRVALVGCGAVARDVHLPALRKLPRVQVVGLCDLDRTRAQELAERFSVASFADCPLMLKEARPDVVHVLTRPESHAEIAEAALEARCHVLVEKPFVYASAEARRLVELARRVGRRLSVVHNYLHHPAVAELRERVAGGDVGDVCSVHFLHGRNDQRYVPDPWYFQTRGGRLGETLPHALYLVSSLLPALSVDYVRARRLGHVRVPDHARGVDPGNDELRVELSSGTGAYATILYSLNASLAQSLVVAGTRATLQATIGAEPAIRTWSAGAPDGAELAGQARHWLVSRLERRLRRRASPRNPADSPHARQIRAFLAGLRGGGEIPVSEDSAVEVVRLWEEVVGRYDPAP